MIKSAKSQLGAATVDTLFKGETEIESLNIVIPARVLCIYAEGASDIE